MQNKKIPLKNYLILTFLSLGTIFLVFYLVSWYNASKEYYQNNSILSGYLSELKSNEVKSYMIDNPEVVIYYASAKDETIKSFEKEFKKLISDNDIKDNIIYVDASKEENINFIDSLKEISNKKIDQLAVPNLIHISDGKVQKILYSSYESINKRDVRNFLIKNGVIIND